MPGCSEIWGAGAKLLYALRSPPPQTVQINYVMKEKKNGQLIQIPNYMQQGKGKSEEDMTGAQGLSDSK